MAEERGEKLYETCYMRVFSYAMTLTADRVQAEELTQEAFFRGHLEAGRLSGRIGRGDLAVRHRQKSLHG